MPKLFMLLIGCTPPGRHIEQHDVFFGIAGEIKELIPALLKFWPEGESKMHIDAWREVSHVNGYSVSVVPAQQQQPGNTARLFFINLGGYRQDEFEEFHYKMIIAAKDKGEAINLSKETAFFRHTGFKGAHAHIDDKYGVDVDDIFEIRDILDEEIKKQFSLLIVPADTTAEDELHLGYFKLDSF
jgi:hypothetical protein